MCPTPIPGSTTTACWRLIHAHHINTRANTDPSSPTHIRPHRDRGSHAAQRRRLVGRVAGRGGGAAAPAQVWCDGIDGMGSIELSCTLAWRHGAPSHPIHISTHPQSIHSPSPHHTYTNTYTAPPPSSSSPHSTNAPPTTPSAPATPPHQTAAAAAATAAATKARSSPSCRCSDDGGGWPARGRGMRRRGTRRCAGWGLWGWGP